MNASLLSEAVDLVDEAALLPPPSRDSFYTRRCCERAELLALVRRIEAAPSDSRAPVFGDSLESVLPTLFADADDGLADPLVGTTVGEYTIEAKIGEGGMGCVYRALYTRHHVEVALKVLQAGFANQERSYGRLQREVELLERCKHPAIVRARSSGQLPDGRTYFTMELVEGQTIIAYCASASANLAQRLRLLIAVCEAVQAAHTVGVIHRDLKPSNILVADAGDSPATPSVRLLDFGIAEATGEADLSVRNYIAVAYAAPEHGLATTPATDIYSLGILLAELVLGRLPFDLVERNPSALWRSVLAEGVQPLHMFADAEARRRLGKVTGLKWRELQAICSKATASAPADRYGTVRELAEDVERFVSERPVRALALSRKRRAMYGFWRLVGRNRLAAAGSVLLMLLLITGLASYTWGLRQARNAALERAAHAEKMQQLTTGLFLDGDGPLDAHTTAEGMVDRAMQSVHTLDAEPEEQANFLLTLGQTYQGFGRYPQAEAAYSQASAIRSRLEGSESVAVAEVLRLQADLLEAQDKPQQGLPLVRRALAIQQRTLKPDDKAVLQSQTIIAQMWTDLGDYQKPVPLLEEVIRRATGKPDLSNEFSNALNNLAIVEDYLGHTERAVALQEQTLAMDRKLEGPRHPDIGIHLISLVGEHIALGQYRVAEAEAREAVSILEEKLPPGAHDTLAAMVHLGDALLHESRWAEAQAVLKQALNTLAVEPVRSRTEASALYVLGGTYEAEGMLPEALATYRHDLAEYKELYPAPHQFWASPLTGIASVLLQQGKPQEAEPAAREAYALRKKSLPSGDPKILSSEILFGRVLASLHRYTEAAPLLQNATTLAEAGDQPTAELRSQAERALLSLQHVQAVSLH